MFFYLLFDSFESICILSSFSFIFVNTSVIIWNTVDSSICILTEFVILYIQQKKQNDTLYHKPVWH